MIMFATDTNFEQGRNDVIAYEDNDRDDSAMIKMKVKTNKHTKAKRMKNPENKLTQEQDDTDKKIKGSHMNNLKRTRTLQGQEQANREIEENKRNLKKKMQM